MPERNQALKGIEGKGSLFYPLQESVASPFARIFIDRMPYARFWALMEAEKHQLHGADLLAIAWGSDETNIDKLYMQNSIIRKDLKKLGSEFCLEKIEGGYFKLVFPYASKAKER